MNGKVFVWEHSSIDFTQTIRSRMMSRSAVAVYLLWICVKETGNANIKIAFLSDKDFEFKFFKLLLGII